MDDTEILICPFCGFKDNNDYQMLLHIEVYHAEDGDSPFVVKEPIVPSSSQATASSQLSPDSASSSPSNSTAINKSYVDCPYKCGERVLEAELQYHTDFHLAENMALGDVDIVAGVELSTGPYNDKQAVKDLSNAFSTNIHNTIRNHDQLNSDAPKSDDKRRTLSLKELFFGSPNRKRGANKTKTSKSGRIRRLGTAELGPYAHEARMPLELQRMLEQGAKVTVTNTIGPNNTLIRVETVANETSDLVPVLARLSLADRTVARAFYCAPEVRHVVKMPREGGFCGYRNIQMLISYIQGSKAPGHQHFPGRLPSIIKLQDMIEDAWDQGYNSTGRIETGGIKLTRKYIGTPEAQALFQGLGIQCEAIAYTSRKESDAYTSLMSALFNYFEDEDTRHDTHRVFMTNRPPVYFQHQGHSMTVVGVEVNTNGAANLVVFDPMFNPSSMIKRLIGINSFRCSDPSKLIRAHRRGESYLSKYKDFELLKLTEEGSITPVSD